LEVLTDWYLQTFRRCRIDVDAKFSKFSASYIRCSSFVIKIIAQYKISR